MGDGGNQELRNGVMSMFLDKDRSGVSEQSRSNISQGNNVDTGTESIVDLFALVEQRKQAQEANDGQQGCQVRKLALDRVDFSIIEGLI